MDCYLNNLSLIQANNGNTINQILQDFISVCEGVRSNSFERIFMPSDYNDIPLSNGVSINGFINANASINARKPIDDFISRVKNIRKNQLRSITNDNPDEKIQYVYHDGTESDFFKKAHNQKSPVISFRTRTVFDAPHLDVSVSYLDKQEQPHNSNSTVYNLSNANHLITHQDFLELKAREQIVSDLEWNAAEIPFRLKGKMVQYLIENNFENMRLSDEQYQMKLFLETGTALAEMNGWVHHSEYSARFSSAEKKRRIFYSAGKRRMYLSIDVRHGEFELHKRTGKHVMSYDFKGEANGKTYNDTSHDLIF